MDCVLQVGACIVSPAKKILATGYNGMPWGCNDSALDWVKEGYGDYLYTETKTPYGKCLIVLMINHRRYIDHIANYYTFRLLK